MIHEFNGKSPNINENTYISESTDIIGDVTIEENCNIWFGTRIRGDMNKITILKNTNIQENSVVHVDVDEPTVIGEGVTIGHGAIIHGCTIGNNVLVGMGSIILNGAKIPDNSIVGAGALVTEHKEFEAGTLIIGSPAKSIRKLTDKEIQKIKQSAKNYIEISKKYK